MGKKRSRPPFCSLSLLLNPGQLSQIIASDWDAVRVWQCPHRVQVDPSTLVQSLTLSLHRLPLPPSFSSSLLFTAFSSLPPQPSFSVPTHNCPHGYPQSVSVRAFRYPPYHILVIGGHTETLVHL